MQRGNSRIRCLSVVSIERIEPKLSLFWVFPRKPAGPTKATLQNQTLAPSAVAISLPRFSPPIASLCFLQAFLGPEPSQKFPIYSARFLHTIYPSNSPDRFKAGYGGWFVGYNRRCEVVGKWEIGE